MKSFSRRQFIKRLAGSSVLLSALGLLRSCGKGSRARVVLGGGGFGGSTCARYLQKFDSSLKITLIEPSRQFITCPFSNMVISGMQTMDSISQGYTAQKNRDINVLHTRVRAIDASVRMVALDNGDVLQYDRLVLSPGIDFKWCDVEGMDESDAEIIPHALQGGSQTDLLRNTLTAMPDGGVVSLQPPKNPFLCPPGPYWPLSFI